MRTDVANDAAVHLRGLNEAGHFADAMAQFQRLPTADASTPEVQLVAASAAARLGDLRTASRLATAARRRLRRATDAPYRLEAVNLMGALAFAQGRLADAETEFRAAREDAAQQGDRLMGARTAQNLAILADLRGHTPDALAALDEARHLYEALGHLRGIAETGHNQSIALRLAGMPAEAARASEAAVAAADRLGEAALQGQVRLGLSEALMALGEFVPAGMVLRTAKDLATQAGAELIVIEAMRIEALFLLTGANDPAAARELASDARGRAAARGAEQMRCEATLVVARAAYRLGQATDANLAMAQARKGLKALGATNLLRHAEHAWTLEQAGAN